MAEYVIDASAAVEYLLKTELGLTISGVIENASLLAPELMDAEVLSALRRVVLYGRLDEARAQMAMEDLRDWPVERLSLRALAPLAWQYYRNISAYDAFYVAAARSHDLPLITTDARLARAPTLNIAIQHLSVSR